MFNNRIVATTVPFATAALFAAGCGAQGSQGSSEPPQEDLHGAPSVQQPLDTTAFQKNPCQALKPEQLQQFNITASGEADPDSTAGPGCTWDDMSSGTVTLVTFATKGQGLKDDYAKRNQYPNFKELPPIQGYPAVMGPNNDPVPPDQSGHCDIDVGVTNDLSVLIQYSAGIGPDKANPCGKAQQVAGEVITTLKSGA